VVELVPSKGGRFEVSMDGRALFEKSKLGRHAEPGEILRKIGAVQKGAQGGK
jgi:selenoprotein W-related protein